VYASSCCSLESFACGGAGHARRDGSLAAAAIDKKPQQESGTQRSEQKKKKKMEVMRKGRGKQGNVKVYCGVHEYCGVAVLRHVYRVHISEVLTILPVHSDSDSTSSHLSFNGLGRRVLFSVLFVFEVTRMWPL
jgi:hypothetical protein